MKKTAAVSSISGNISPLRPILRGGVGRWTRVVLAAVVLTPASLWAHGMGAHRHGAEEEHVHTGEGEHATGAVADGTDPMVTGLADQDHAHDRRWGAELGTFFESKHIHYGVTEADGSPVYGTELTLWYDRFSLTSSGLFALENAYSEWNFTAAYTFELGPVFIVPGYNFRLSDHGADEHGEESHDEHDGEHHGEHEEHAEGGHEEHTHNPYGHELFLVVGTDAIPYVTPSAGFLWDFYENTGGFLEFRLDGNIPVVRDRIFLEPYTSLGLNFGYNTKEYYGWNNFIYGLNVRVAVNSIISIYGGVGQNVPFRAAELEGSEPEVFATTGVSFSF